MMIQIPKAELRNAQGVIVTTFSGVIRNDPDKDRDEVYGSCESVLAVMRAVSDKGTGLSIVFNDGNSEQTKPLMIRDANLRSRLVWAHVLPQ